jgi:hypothetical protein
MPSRREAPKPPANEQKDKPKKERKHWLDYAIFFFASSRNRVGNF